MTTVLPLCRQPVKQHPNVTVTVDFKTTLAPEDIEDLKARLRRQIRVAK